MGSSPRSRGTRASMTGTPSYTRFIPAIAGNTLGAACSMCPATVHPRDRGEHGHRNPSAAPPLGSSPRSRGTHPPTRPPRAPRRFIPAIAGNTSSQHLPNTPPPVHPRDRGEHSGCRPRQPSQYGSSPRSRGTLERSRYGVRPLRFIPAIAGNTRGTPCPGEYPAVHPRDRGEHYKAGGTAGHALGSSPRSRGTLCGGHLLRVQLRFIPAIAGNTDLRRVRASTEAVHPRDRGEHPRGCTSAGPSTGSSPRSRGTLQESFLDFAGIRFIPAIAGNTAPFRLNPERQPVHPRDRGEHQDSMIEAIAPAGSSPRSRGTRGMSAEQERAERFIPAIAGNTSFLSIRMTPMPVHPRDRGEHVCLPRPSPSSPGSSPRSRGTLFPCAFHFLPLRFIPAIAGNTNGAFRYWQTSAVHPRDRGEHQFRRGGDQAGVRFIPAIAGNTPGISTSGRRCTVHPRDRGEHDDSGTANKLAIGSSPRSRGTPARIFAKARIFRFIPAIAGNTIVRRAASAPISVHPRDRGEHCRG